MARQCRRQLVFSMMVPFVLVAGCGGGGGDVIPPFSLYFSVAVADLNGDSRLDIASCYTFIAGPPPHPGYVAVNLQDPARPGTFLPATAYSVGNDPVEIAIGDLNGDGQDDLVTANTVTHVSGIGDRTVSVLLQDGTGTGHFLPATDFHIANIPESVAIGDMNDDNLPDLAVGNRGGVSLLFQDPGNPGVFLPETLIDVGGAVADVAIEDLDGDGLLDLVASESGDVRVLLQVATAPGTFSGPVIYAAGEQPSGVAIADLDGDVRPDLAVANHGTPSGVDPSVSVLLQNIGAPGTFLAATNYPTMFRPGVVAIADLDGDSRPDLAVSNGGSLSGICPPNCSLLGSVSVLLQDPTMPGGYQAATNYITDDQVLSVTTGDMNDDGKPDLVLAYGDGVVIQFQDPAAAGEFMTATAIPK